MRIIFIGCVNSSYLILKELIKNGKEIVGVVTKGVSGYNSDFKSLNTLCEEYEIPYVLQEVVGINKVEEFIRKKKPDLIYCFGWSSLLSERILKIAQIGCIGFHPAQLPHNKGRHPLIWALALGLDKTASSFFVMTQEADAGDIVSQEIIYIDESDDAQSLYDKVMVVAVAQVIEFTNKIEKTGTIPFLKMNQGGNCWRKRGINDGMIDWRMSAKAIYNLVRSLTHPYVGAHYMHGEKIIKVWKVSVWKYSIPDNYEPGLVLKIFTDGTYLVKVYDGAIHVLDASPISLKVGDYL